MERKRKLDEQLNAKVSADFNELIQKATAYQKDLQENSRRYWEQQLKQELDMYERDIASGNTISATAHKVTIEGIQRMLRALQ